MKPMSRRKKKMKGKLAWFHSPQARSTSPNKRRDHARLACSCTPVLTARGSMRPVVHWPVKIQCRTAAPRRPGARCWACWLTRPEPMVHPSASHVGNSLARGTTAYNHERLARLALPRPAPPPRLPHHSPMASAAMLRSAARSLRLRLRQPLEQQRCLQARQILSSSAPTEVRNLLLQPPPPCYSGSTG